ncbi:MAG: hypothetical protein ABJQ29_16355 [Luteolibacter sp.]
MAQKVYRPTSLKASSKRGLKPRKRKKDRGSYPLAFLILGFGFFILGTLNAIHPVPFHGGGGYTGNGVGGSFVYTEQQSSAFGICFAIMGLIFFYWGYRVTQNVKR